MIYLNMIDGTILRGRLKSKFINDVEQIRAMISCLPPLHLPKIGRAPRGWSPVKNPEALLGNAWE